MKNRREIVENWLPRYTGVPLNKFGDYILLTNFDRYVQLFAQWHRVPVQGKDKPMSSATAGDITIINFGMGSATAATVMDLLSAIKPKAVLFLGKCGGTIDDAAGEAFDKIARLLGAPYPGGAALSALAAKVSRGGRITPLPIAKTDQPYDFSFSGVKTAAIRQALLASGITDRTPGRAATLTRQFTERPLPEGAAIAIAAATEQAIVGALRAGVQRALRANPDCSLIVGGGVAANVPLRAALALVAIEERRTISVPPLKWCTDNAAMIGAAGDALLRDGRGVYQDPSTGLEVHAQWRIGSEVPA